MPTHVYRAGPNESDNDVLARAIAEIERKGERFVQAMHGSGFPISEWVIVTSPKPRNEKESR